MDQIVIIYLRGDQMIYIINIILGGIFVYCDIYHIDSNLIKWLISFNCFIYLVIKKVSPPAILASALAFIGDYFLLFTNHYLIGISLFIMVQLTYMYLIKYVNYFPFVFLGLILINPLISLALIYLGFSLLNLYQSFKTYKKLFIAVFLLLCCDIIIALVYLKLIDSVFAIMIWIFYLPSQLFYIYSQTFFQKSFF